MQACHGANDVNRRSGRKNFPNFGTCVQTRHRPSQSDEMLRCMLRSFCVFPSCQPASCGAMSLQFIYKTTTVSLTREQAFSGRTREFFLAQRRTTGARAIACVQNDNDFHATLFSVSQVSRDWLRRERVGPNEKEISHGRVSWQAHRTHCVMGPLASSIG